IFEFQNTRDQIIFQRVPDFFSRESIEHGIVRDLLHLFKARKVTDATLVAKTANERTFQFKNDSGTIEEFTILKTSGVSRSLEAQEGRIVREVTYEQPKIIQGWKRKLPTKIKLRNYLYDYRLEISLVEFSPKLPTSFDKMTLDQ